MTWRNGSRRRRSPALGPPPQSRQTRQSLRIRPVKANCRSQALPSPAQTRAIASLPQLPVKASTASLRKWASQGDPSIRHFEENLNGIEHQRPPARGVLAGAGGSVPGLFRSRLELECAALQHEEAQPVQDLFGPDDPRAPALQ